MLYLVRHGTTDQGFFRAPGDLRPATREEWLQDNGLTTRGREEAEALRTRFARMMPPDRVISSPRRRTLETAAIALPDRSAAQEDQLHEWYADEGPTALYRRARWLLGEGEDSLIAAFTHGGLIRAVIAAVQVGPDAKRFEAAFHDLRRVLHIWNGSLTVIGHGASGLELYAVNLCDAIDALVGGPGAAGRFPDGA